ncbi:MAG: hypothetical protein FK733_00260 [Asgard group archaeon]|nr:hypothetical protein [Asgard group archaeon]
MKWSEFRQRFSEAEFNLAKNVCDEVYPRKSKQINQDGKLCRQCREKEGKYLFPCREVCELYQKKSGRELKLLIA